MPGAEGRIGPFEHGHTGTISRGHGVGDSIQPPAERSDELHRPLLGVGGAADRLNGRQDLVQRHRVERDHLGPAPQVLQRLVHFVDVDGAHGAQVLGHDQIGIEVAQRSLIEGVEVFARRHAGPDHGVDLRRRQAIGQGRGGDDPPTPRLGRKVTLEGHAGHVGARADGEQDLRGGGEKRDDAHAAGYQPPRLRLG